MNKAPSMKFYNKKRNEEQIKELFHQLDQNYPGQYELRQGKNELIIPIINEETKLVIVGTAIPSNLPFFYMGEKNWIYNWIDEVNGTNLRQLKKDGNVKGILEELLKLHIAFLDISDWCCNKKGSVKDDDIRGYTIKNEHFAFLKRISGLTVISASQPAQFVLEKEFGIKSEYKQLYNRAKKAPWIDILREIK